MNKELVIEKLKNYFKDNEDVEMAFLFGSYAQDRVWKKSDIDIGIYIKGGFNFDRYSKINNEIESILGVEVDLIPLDRTSPVVAWEAIRGTPIIIKNERFYIEYMLKVSMEAEDFQKFILDMWKLREAIRNESIK